MAEVRGGLLAGGTDMTCMHASHSLSQCFQVRFWWCQLVACNALVACVIARCLSLCTHPVLQGQASLKSCIALQGHPIRHWDRNRSHAMTQMSHAGASAHQHASPLERAGLCKQQVYASNRSMVHQ